MPPMPHGNRYAMPANVQLESPVRKARLRPLRSASRPTKMRLHKAIKEKVPMTKPTVRSEPPRSCRTWGARPGRTLPKPKKPKKVAAINHQNRPLNSARPHCFMMARGGGLRRPILRQYYDPPSDVVVQVPGLLVFKGCCIIHFYFEACAVDVELLAVGRNAQGEAVAA